MNALSISAIVLTKNEEKNIERCLRSLDFCTEIIVIDDFSTDKTVQIARKFTDKVVQHDLNNDFTSQRNFGMGLAKSDWVFYVDADEEVSLKLRTEILTAFHKGHLTKRAYFVPRHDYWWGRELRFGEVLDARTKGIVRFVRKNSGKWTGKVHERFAIKSVIGRFNHHIYHYPHPTMREFLTEINQYSTIRSRELFAIGMKPSLYQTIVYPPGKFISNYFLKFGFLDGVAGFAYAFLMSFHSFLVRAKLYQYAHIDATI